MRGSVTVERRARVDVELLQQLGVPGPAFVSGELERIQLAQRGHGSTTYLVGCDGVGRPVGLLPVYTSGSPWPANVDPTALFGLPDDVVGPVLCVAGSLAVPASYLTVGTSVGEADAVWVTGTLVEGARAVAREHGCGHVLLPYLDQVQAEWLGPLRISAIADTVREKAVLEVGWDSFEEYAAWLPTRRRTPVRRERRRFDDSGIDVREHRMSEVVGKLAPMLAQTELRHGNPLDPGQIEFHYALLGMLLGKDFTALVAYRDGRPVACSLLLACGSRWISKAWGCDYAATGEDFLYFNLLFYEPIVRAIEQGIEAIDYGLGGLEAKTQRGCVVQPLRTVLVGAEL